MRLAIMLICCAVALGQDAATTASQPDRKSQREDYGLGVGTRGKQYGFFDILSDTQGVDFAPYMTDVMVDLRENWYRLIPESAEMRQGKLAIEFAINKKGEVADMKLVATSGDTALDRPAWGAIARSSPFKPLPNEFHGRYLALRVRFYYNPAKSGLDGSVAASPVSAPSKSGAVVSISSSADVYVAPGASRVMTATVTGTKKQAFKWSLGGMGCSGSACGEMMGNLYVAPSVAPMPPVVTLTATAKADHTARASVRIHIVQPLDAH